ncbi:zinc-binding dehydrogenase [Streptomyces sp. NP160]|uniref:alcohol dehydrogenase catalytic domain-containing protein n=1 Tax=Streptomyces sp. NP160 TaxID=2586637 RepID=UPI001118C891|nr:alcohol dehydrogenase catalytic domain-containing protein [Streptomyces sp. NP160]TNM59816.1 zinc-binding dehydrogenase [Streptomyces sp. NP160]
MLAARFHRYGNPDVLVIEQAPEPEATPGSVRIRVQAASVNPIDVLLRAGHLHQVLPLNLPAVPGRDAAGVVDQVGPGVSGTSVGDVVFGLGGLADTTAEHAVLTAWAPAPSTWTSAQAAAAGLASATALAALDALGQALDPSTSDLDALAGRTLLIEGASGAVGSAAAAFAVAAGARVIGTARQDKHGPLAELGVLPTTYGPGLSERVADLAPQGVDAALHAAPSSSLPDLVEIVGNASAVVTVIDAEGAARLGSAKVDARNDSTLLRRAAALGQRGLYSPRVAHELPLAAASRAHALAEGGSGKVVITVP